MRERSGIRLGLPAAKRHRRFANSCNEQPYTRVGGDIADNMASELPGPSHTYYTMDEVLQMLDDPRDIDINEPVCDGSDDDLECDYEGSSDSDER